MSIVREMLKRRDKNSIPLLRILTCECMAIEQILQLWFLVKSSQFYYDKVLFNSISTSHHNHHNHHHLQAAVVAAQHHHHRHNSANSGVNVNSSSSNLTPPVHQACANMMDEIVGLWKLACLNPLVNDFDELQLYHEQLCQWQQTVFDNMKKFYLKVVLQNSNNAVQNNNNSNNNWCGGSNSASPANGNSSNSGGNVEKILKRLDMDLFAAFLPAIHATSLKWSGFDLDRMPAFRAHASSILAKIELNNSSAETISPCSTNYSGASSSSSSSSTSSFSSSDPAEVRKSNVLLVGEKSVLTDVAVSDMAASLYSFEFDPVKLRAAYKQQQAAAAAAESSGLSSSLSKDIESFKLRFLNPRPPLATLGQASCNETRLEELLTRCESLSAHGFLAHACVLAQLLAQHMLLNANSLSPVPSIFNNRYKIGLFLWDESGNF